VCRLEVFFLYHSVPIRYSFLLAEMCLASVCEIIKKIIIIMIMSRQFLRHNSRAQFKGTVRTNANDTLHAAMKKHSQILDANRNVFRAVVHFITVKL